MTLREKLVDAMWATLFAKDESPEVIASFKDRWPEDLVSSNRRADAALKVFADWLESEPDEIGAIAKYIFCRCADCESDRGSALRTIRGE
tara:strand:+ start:668 stop:937 length:270 start_codon:yes stop_codon:yes gene_type:complete